jgi:hypothetical protein
MPEQDRSPQPDREQLLVEAGFPPERVARLDVECGIARGLTAIDDAGARLDRIGDHDQQRSVGQALVAARHSLIEALRRCNGGAR